jgi:hypothetical protein
VVSFAPYCVLSTFAEKNLQINVWLATQREKTAAFFEFPSKISICVFNVCKTQDAREANTEGTSRASRAASGRFFVMASKKCSGQRFSWSFLCAFLA